MDKTTKKKTNFTLSDRIMTQIQANIFTYLSSFPYIIIFIIIIYIAFIIIIVNNNIGIS